jgi:hypothetical protein
MVPWFNNTVSSLTCSDTACDAVPVQRTHAGERLQDHQVQCSLEEFESVFSHSVRLLMWYCHMSWYRSPMQWLRTLLTVRMQILTRGGWVLFNKAEVHDGIECPRKGRSAGSQGRLSSMRVSDGCEIGRPLVPALPVAR